ncbi:MAG: PQQ-dependent sugar dehydrogenase, partial [Planctomycetes bacterium]|nr:PQQ-dependent sugar dehydrogenase [Planctomycetota bacterium]
QGTVLEGRLSRFTSQDGGKTASPSTEEVVLRIKRDKQWHWGGRPTFGPDGYLYMTTGDGGTHRQAQNLDNINGKMLRIDVDGGNPYAIPPDNPFAGGGGLPEIYAYGFRNPWRWSFDSLTGNIWEGDVGPSEREEINRIRKGGNYGWSLFEGTLCKFSETCDYSGLEEPVFEYTHDTSLEISGFAVIGGYVYRGSGMPQFYGNYIFADTMGKIIGFDPASPSATAVLYADIGNTILSIAESRATRELYVLSPGAITRI